MHNWSLRQAQPLYVPPISKHCMKNRNSNGTSWDVGALHKWNECSLRVLSSVLFCVFSGVLFSVLCSECVGAWKPVNIAKGISAHIHLQRASLPIYIVTFSSNFNCVVCLIVAFVCLLCVTCSKLLWDTLITGKSLTTGSQKLEEFRHWVLVQSSFVYQSRLSAWRHQSQMCHRVWHKELVIQKSLSDSKEKMGKGGSRKSRMELKLGSGEEAGVVAGGSHKSKMVQFSSSSSYSSSTSTSPSSTQTNFNFNADCFIEQTKKVQKDWAKSFYQDLSSPSAKYQEQMNLPPENSHHSCQYGKAHLDLWGHIWAVGSILGAPAIWQTVELFCRWETGGSCQEPWFCSTSQRQGENSHPIIGLE